VRPAGAAARSICSRHVQRVESRNFDNPRRAIAILDDFFNLTTLRARRGAPATLQLGDPVRVLMRRTPRVPTAASTAGPVAAAANARRGGSRHRGSRSAG
jgi:hypothetical protein